MAAASLSTAVTERFRWRAFWAMTLVTTVWAIVALAATPAVIAFTFLWYRFAHLDTPLI